MNCSVSPAPTRQSATSTYEQVPAMGAANERWPFPSTRPEIYLAMRGGVFLYASARGASHSGHPLLEVRIG